MLCKIERSSATVMSKRGAKTYNGGLRGCLLRINGVGLVNALVLLMDSREGCFMARGKFLMGRYLCLQSDRI